MVVVFSWKLLKNWVPNMDNLIRCKVVTYVGSWRCFCDDPMESVSDLFLLCEISEYVSCNICRLLGWLCVPHQKVYRFSCISRG